MRLQLTNDENRIKRDNAISVITKLVIGTGIILLAGIAAYVLLFTLMLMI